MGETPSISSRALLASADRFLLAGTRIMRLGVPEAYLGPLSSESVRSPGGALTARPRNARLRHFWASDENPQRSL